MPARSVCLVTLSLSEAGPVADKQFVGASRRHAGAALGPGACKRKLARVYLLCTLSLFIVLKR